MSKRSSEKDFGEAPEKKNKKNDTDESDYNSEEEQEEERDHVEYSSSDSDESNYDSDGEPIEEYKNPRDEYYKFHDTQADIDQLVRDGHTFDDAGVTWKQVKKFIKAGHTFPDSLLEGLKK